MLKLKIEKKNRYAIQFRPSFYAVHHKIVAITGILLVPVVTSSVFNSQTVSYKLIPPTCFFSPPSCLPSKECQLNLDLQPPWHCCFSFTSITLLKNAENWMLCILSGIFPVSHSDGAAGKERMPPVLHTDCGKETLLPSITVSPDACNLLGDFHNIHVWGVALTLKWQQCGCNWIM